MATERLINFERINDHVVPRPVRPQRKKGRALAMTPKQLRERARRSKKGAGSLEFETLYKPIEEWDAEELARGRPRDCAGGFRGRAPGWLSRELHEEAMSRFRAVIRDGMNANTNIALETIRDIMTDKRKDDSGRPIIAAGTKLDAAKFLIDHTLGKPKQRIETDISVKLQGMLATTIITPGMLPAQSGSMELTSPRSFEDAEWFEEE